jgi:hypothetical protein
MLEVWKENWETLLGGPEGNRTPFYSMPWSRSAGILRARGPCRSRTGDLRNANAAHYQLC